MKRLSTLILFCTIILSQGLAQGRGHGKFDYGKFKSEKIAYITESIELTPAEAETFWPVYNEFEKKKWDLISERHDLERELKENLKEMSDQEYIKLSEKLSSFPLLDGKLNLEYNKKFLEIISPKKVVQLYLAEVNFRSKLLRQYRERDKKENEKKN